MGKKNKPPLPGAPAVSVPQSPLFSKTGKILMGAGLLAVAVGFYLVTLTDPLGQNWASATCPFFILGGYALMGIGIVWPDPDESMENQINRPEEQQ